MEKLKIAKYISTFTNPPILCIPLFLIICIVLSFERGVFDISKFIHLEVISFVFASVLPMAIIVLWTKRIGTDTDISNRSDRFTPLIVGVVSYFIGFLVSLTTNADNFLTVLLLCYSINTGVVLLFTIRWKISVHTTGLSGPVGALILLLGPFGALFGILYPILIWSRVLLKKHTMAQAVSGGVQGFFLTVLEFYLFITIFSLETVPLTSLEESVFYILAIIFAPVILGILSYIGVSHKKWIFYLLELIGAFIFLMYTPASVFIIFALVSLSAILISYYDGDEFSWFKILKSS